MYKNKKILAIIPARGGSKGIPFKNIKIFYGKPLIAWSILSALKSKIDRVIVTTDNPQIAKIAKKYGAEVPFLRPSYLAADSVACEPVIQHVIDWLKDNENYNPDGVALLLPTNPLRRSEHINQAIKMFTDRNLDYVVSVAESTANYNPYWMLKKLPNNKVVMFNGQPLNRMKAQRQLLPVFYFKNDIIHLFKPSNLQKTPPSLCGDKTELYIMDDSFTGDINTMEEWYVTLDKFKRLKNYEKI